MDFKLGLFNYYWRPMEKKFNRALLGYTLEKQPEVNQLFSLMIIKIEIKTSMVPKTKLMDINNSQKQEILTYKTKIEQSNEQLNDADAFIIQ